MRGDARRIPALLRRGGRSPVVGGGVPPTITVAPVLTWTVEIGESPTLTDPTYTGDTGTITWTLYRDGVADGTIVDVDKATAEAYAAVAADIGPDLHFEATVTNGSGSDSDVTNAEVFDDATYLPDTAIGVSTAGLTLADGDTTVDSWAATLGGVACTLSAAAAVNRPAYSATGGAGARPLVTGDGAASSADCLRGTITKGSAWDSYEIGVVGQRLSFTNLGDIWLAYDQGGFVRFSIEDQDAGRFRFVTPGGGSPANTTDPDTAAGHVSGDAASGTINARYGGTVEGTASGTVTSRTDGGTLMLFARSNNTIGVNCALQAWYAGPALTSDQRTHLRALLTYHTGVAC